MSVRHAPIVLPPAQDDPDDVHVYPQFGPVHETSRACWCKPEQDKEVPWVVIHNVHH